MKHLFIVNPTSGKGSALKYIPMIHEIFKNIREEYIIEITKRPGHAIDLVKKYTKNENYRVYSVGGDGTLNEVVNGIISTDSVLGIIPAGTGNDFIKNIANDIKNEDLLLRTIKGKERIIDVGKVNERCFINIASIGIDAEIAFNVTNFKKIPFVRSMAAYVLSILSTLVVYKNKNVSLTIDAKEHSNKVLLLAVANGKCYGGGMKVAPDAKIDDGYFNVCLISPMNKIKMALLFPLLIMGKHSFIKQVQIKKAKVAKVVSKEELSINIDGEIIKSRYVDFRIIPNAMKVIEPF